MALPSPVWFILCRRRRFFAVKDTDAVRTDDISTLETVHGDALIHDRLLFLHRYVRIGKLRNMAHFHDDIFVGCQLLLRTKISLCLILTVLAGLVASGASSIALNYNSTEALQP